MAGCTSGLWLLIFSVGANSRSAGYVQAAQAAFNEYYFSVGANSRSAGYVKAAQAAFDNYLFSFGANSRSAGYVQAVQQAVQQAQLEAHQQAQQAQVQQAQQVWAATSSMQEVREGSHHLTGGQYSGPSGEYSAEPFRACLKLGVRPCCNGRMALT